MQTASLSINADQESALRTILEQIQHPDAVVTLAGYAGTGKTFLTRALIDQLTRKGWRVLLTAPTHQALAVARGHSDAEAMTIHSALGLVVRENADGSAQVTQRGRPKLRGYDLVIVDEASMVGRELYKTLMEERRCAVLFVGDPGQLPPVGEKESPAFAEVAQRITLTRIVRQAEGSTLIALAHRIREEAENGRRLALDSVRPYVEGDGYLVQCGKWEAADVVAELVTEARSEGFEAVGLAYRNEDVDRINAAVHRALHPNAELPYAPGERILFRAPYHEEGREREEPLVRTNEYATVLEVSGPRPGLFEIPTLTLSLELQDGRVRSVPAPLNGRLWRRAVKALFAEHRAASAKAKLATSPTEIDQLRSAARDASSRAWLLRTRLADIQHAYAMTAHRAQGSTFEIVILHWSGLDRMRDDFEHARAVYVAATRPSRYLAIVES